jgi:hypothetical protein
MSKIPQSHNIDNYYGPYPTEAEAIEAVVNNFGECRGTLWLKNGEYWSSEERWNTLPEGARAVDMLDVFQD